MAVSLLLLPSYVTSKYSKFVSFIFNSYIIKYKKRNTLNEIYFKTAPQFCDSLNNFQASFNFQNIPIMTISISFNNKKWLRSKLLKLKMKIVFCFFFFFRIHWVCRFVIGKGSPIEEKKLSPRLWIRNEKTIQNISFWKP